MTSFLSKLPRRERLKRPCGHSIGVRSLEGNVGPGGVVAAIKNQCAADGVFRHGEGDAARERCTQGQLLIVTAPRHSVEGVSVAGAASLEFKIVAANLNTTSPVAVKRYVKDLNMTGL